MLKVVQVIALKRQQSEINIHSFFVHLKKLIPNYKAYSYLREVMGS